MSDLAVGQRARIAGHKVDSFGARWNGLRVIVVEAGGGGGLAACVRVIPLTERPDGHGLAGFWWETVHIEAAEGLDGYTDAELVEEVGRRGSSVIDVERLRQLQEVEARVERAAADVAIKNTVTFVYCGKVGQAIDELTQAHQLRAYAAACL